MATSGSRVQATISSASPGSVANDANRVKSVATRLTEAELSEIERAASKAGKKLAEWLRDAALSQARAHDERTDAVLLAEIMAVRSLMLNLFAKASQGPLSTEDIRKMSAYADSIKDQKAREFLARRQSESASK